MKIALVGPISGRLLNYLNDIEVPATHNFNMNSDLANELVRRGHEVHVFTGGAVGKIFEREVDGHSITVAPRFGRKSALYLYRSTRAGLALALKRRGPFDAVHGHWMYDYADAALSQDPNAIVTIHDWPEAILKMDPGIASISRYLISRSVRRRIRRATAPSEYIRTIAQNQMGIADVEVVPNGFPQFMFAETQRSLTSCTKILAVNVGFDSRKNVSKLLVAFQAVRAEFPSAELELIGPGYGIGEEAYIFAQKKHLLQNVIFRGRVDRLEILKSLQETSLFVHPSIEESFGLVIIEAMSQGVGVLGGDQAGAVPWLLDYGKAGLLTDVTQPDHISRAIVYALKNRDMLRRLAENGRARARANFTVEVMTDRYLRRYQEAQTVV